MGGSVVFTCLITAFSTLSKLVPSFHQLRSGSSGCLNVSNYLLLVSFLLGTGALGD